MSLADLARRIDASYALPAEALGNVPSAAYQATKQGLRGPLIDMVVRGQGGFDAQIRRLWSTPEATTSTPSA